jgi:hypothetical protein
MRHRVEFKKFQVLTFRNRALQNSTGFLTILFHINGPHALNILCLSQLNTIFYSTVEGEGRFSSLYRARLIVKLSLIRNI